ncbi:hypothetical protein VDGD_21326 [Verticillium dahliae]|nr:hypothetical protein VdG1_05810 [Verticillium dahliae VDG1]RBQ76071.1 hypothetical protein VDGD_21326 [Verticillium dahliae]
MQLHIICSAMAAMLSFGIAVQASPLRCSDFDRDLILSGKAQPEICCSYGICKGDVVIRGG